MDEFSKPPPKFNRRNFLKLAGIGVGGTVLAIGAEKVIKEIKKTNETVGIQILEVKDLKDKPDIQKGIAELAKKVYGRESLSPNDKVIALPMPKENQSIVITLPGVAAPETGKGKGGKGKASEQGFSIRFQRTDDTRSNVIVGEPDQDSPVVHRIENTLNPFNKFIPGSQENLLNWNGWAKISFPDGKDYPLLTSIGITQDNKILLLMANQEAIEAGYNPGIGQISAAKGDITYPRSE